MIGAVITHAIGLAKLRVKGMPVLEWTPRLRQGKRGQITFGC
jgi:hypothetical protein